MKIFTVALTAMRDHPQDSSRTEMAVASALILFDEMTGDTSTPESGARDFGLLTFPIEEGWKDHWEALTELEVTTNFRRSPSNIRGSEGYEVTWSVRALEEKIE